MLDLATEILCFVIAIVVWALVALVFQAGVIIYHHLGWPGALAYVIFAFYLFLYLAWKVGKLWKPSRR